MLIGHAAQREAELLAAPVAITFAGRAASAPGDPAGLERASFWLRASVPQARVREPAPPHHLVPVGPDVQSRLCRPKSTVDGPLPTRTLAPLQPRARLGV